MPDSLKDRIDRIYAALGACVEKDMTKLPAEVKSTPRFLSVFQDFSGGQSQAELENLAYSLVHNVAHLRDHLRKWAKVHGRDPEQVDQTVKRCPALQIVCDLSNVDKHGMHGRKTRSGKKLRLANVTRVLRLMTSSAEESCVAVRFGRIPMVSGDGRAEAVITGDALDQNGQRVGDLHKVACEALAAWENLLKEWEVGG